MRALIETNDTQGLSNHFNGEVSIGNQVVNKNGETALYLAATSGAIDVVTLLLSEKNGKHEDVRASINADFELRGVESARSTVSPMSGAIQAGHFNIVILFYRAGCQIDWSSLAIKNLCFMRKANECSPVMCAIKYLHRLGVPVPVNILLKLAFTVLSYSSRFSEDLGPRFTVLTCSSWFSENLKPRYGVSTFLDYLLSQVNIQRDELTPEVISAYQDPFNLETITPPLFCVLLREARWWDSLMFIKMISLGVSADVVDDKGYSPLFYLLSRERQAESKVICLFAYLLLNGAKPGVNDKKAIYDFVVNHKGSLTRDIIQIVESPSIGRKDDHIDRRNYKQRKPLSDEFQNEAGIQKALRFLKRIGACVDGEEGGAVDGVLKRAFEAKRAVFGWGPAIFGWGKRPAAYLEGCRLHDLYLLSERLEPRLHPDPDAGRKEKEIQLHYRSPSSP